MIFRNLALRLRMLFGYVPNAEWLRVILNREVLFDRARAQAAIAEMERCLTLQRRGDLCARLRNLA